MPITESLVGVSVACTRQNAGRDAKRRSPGAFELPPGVKAPAATVAAATTVTPA
jgi:hypothetical protein